MKISATQDYFNIKENKMTNRDDSNFFSGEGYDEEDFNNHEDEESEPNEEENFLNKNEALYAMELDHLDNRLFKETNIAMLKEAVKIAQGSFLWKITSMRKRLKNVLSIYYDLFDHVNFDKKDID